MPDHPALQITVAVTGDDDAPTTTVSVSLNGEALGAKEIQPSDAASVADWVGSVIGEDAHQKVKAAFSAETARMKQTMDEMLATYQRLQASEAAWSGAFPPPA